MRISEIREHAKRKRLSRRISAGTIPASAVPGVGDLDTPGLPLRSLALEHLLGRDTLPLGGIIGLAGPPMSFKSTLALDLSRIVLEAGGSVARCDTEGGKIAPAVIASTLGAFTDRVMIFQTQSVEEVHEEIDEVVALFRRSCSKKDEPLAIILDSLAGAAAEDRIDNIHERGHATRGYPHEAALWNKWLPWIAREIEGWPIVLILVNHSKDDLSGGIRYPGGREQVLRAQASLHILPASLVERPDRQHHRLAIAAVKPRRGPDVATIDLPIITDRSSTTPIHILWNTAAAALLADNHADPRLRGVIEVTSNSGWASDPARTFSCAEFDLVNVSGEEMGAAVHADASLMEKLRAAFGIARTPVWNADGGGAEERIEQDSGTGIGPDPVDVTHGPSDGGESR